MANNLAVKMSPKVVNRFTRKSALDGLFTNDYSWEGVSAVKVYTNDALPLQDYTATDNSGGSRYGAMTEVGDTVQEMTVTQNKAIHGSMDETFNTQELQIKKANMIVKQTTDEVLIPAFDKYCLGKLAAGAGKTQASTGVISKSNIVERITAAGAYMSEQDVPEDGRVIFMSYTTKALLKNAPEVLNLQEAGQKALVHGVCGVIDGMQIRPVPTKRMPASTDFIIVKKGVACAPKKIHTLKVVDGGSKLDGYELVGHFLYDCFVLETKNAGIFVQSSGK